MQRIDMDSTGRVVRYTINFYRKRKADGWYDEVRYDSHELRKGRDIQSPHFHMKLHSSFKNDVDAVEEIKGLIDNQLEEVEKVLKR